MWTQGRREVQKACSSNSNDQQMQCKQAGRLAPCKTQSWIIKYEKSRGKIQVYTILTQWHEKILSFQYFRHIHLSFSCNQVSLKLPLICFLELDFTQAGHEVFKNIQNPKYFHCAISYMSLSFIRLSAYYICSHHQILTVSVKRKGSKSERERNVFTHYSNIF